MYKFILIVILGIFVIQPGITQSFYDINSINTIEVNFKEANWDYLLDKLMADGQEERLLGSVTINGEVFDSIGVRYKGNSSYRANQIKNPLNIKLDYVIKDQEIEGFGTLKLANVFKDPSFIRETLSYELARQYFPASMANYAKVYINGKYLGLYTSVQDVDKFFMRTHFNTDRNVRLKGEISGGLPPGQMGGVWQYFGDDTTAYAHKYALESDYGWEKLTAFLDTINHHNEELEKVLNVDRHLWFLAFSNLLVNLDGPINNPQNYYLFEDNAGRFNPIPWDLNESFGVFTNLQSGGQMNTSSLQKLNPFVNININDYPIISKTLSIDRYKKMYVAHMKTIIQENFSNEWYKDRGVEIQNLIASEVQSDPNKFYTYSNFLSNLNSGVGSPGPPPQGGQIIGIGQLMESRIDYLNNLTEFKYAQPVITDVIHNSDNIQANSALWITANVNEAESVFLKYRNKHASVFQVEPMYDDGSHEDGAAGDGVYGAMINTSYSDIEYYIYAENNDAASFSPERAEYEFYSVEIASSDLVINEFMADNEAYQADQDGEFDDWIEIYNNGSEAISLNGYFLSDDTEDLEQWIFPDTILASNAYIVVWADKDEDQAGLHADIKLSKSGEVIILSDPSANIIDEIEFEEQLTDLSTGRFPNGSGDFIQMNPTIGAENESGTTITKEVEEDELQALVFYPNPFREDLLVEFELKKAKKIDLNLTNSMGQTFIIADGEYFSAGKHQMVLEANKFGEGLWICTLVTEDSIESYKLVKLGD